MLGIDAANVRRGYRRFVHQRHTLYYRKSKSGITIVRMLGPGMSVERSIDRLR
jgi:hypothetical protein